jgi:nicotinate-nucleotide adenylyltransferase
MIFGGTFDPPHRAHVELPPRAAKAVGCNRIIYVPAAINPLKADHPPAPAADRLAMLRLALRHQPDVEISTIELDRSGPSYTIDTLTALRQQLGDDIIMRLLIGADQALEFHHWKQWQRVLEMAFPVVMLRPPWGRAAFERQLLESFGEAEARRWMQQTVDLPQIDISATALRDALAHSADTSVMLDPKVADYIRSHRLYGAKIRPAAPE